MDKEMREYLQSVDKCLKPMTAPERNDILREIESEMQELQQSGMTTRQVLDRLGSPKALAKSYLQDLLTKNYDLRWNRLLMTFAYCGLVGFSGIFVIPVLGITAPALMLCGIVSPIAGLVKLIAHLFGTDIPYIMFQFGNISLSPWAVFPASVVLGLLLFFLGRGAWKLLLRYMRTAAASAKRL